MLEYLFGICLAFAFAFIGLPLITIAVGILQLAKPLNWIKTQMELEQKANELKMRTER